MENDDSGKESAITRKTSGKPASTLLLVFALIIAIIALIIALRVLQQNRFRADEHEALAQSIQNLDKNQKNILTSLEVLQKQKNDNQEALKRKVATLDKAFQAFREQNHYRTEDWLLLKARYYLELAEIQAHWGDNPAMTIALLDQADSLLSTANNARLFDIRQTLANEIARLKTIPPLDLVGLLSRLDAQQKAVANLGINKHLTMPAENPGQNTPEPASWRSHFKASMHTLEKMVIIRHRDQDIQPLYSSLQIALLRETVRNNLQEAKWGLLRQNAAVYNLALEETIANIKASFDTSAENTQAFMEELKALKALVFQPQPALDLQKPIQSLNQLIHAKSPEKDHD